MLKKTEIIYLSNHINFIDMITNKLYHKGNSLRIIQIEIYYKIIDGRSIS